MEKPNSKGADKFVVGLLALVATVVMFGFIIFMGGFSAFDSKIEYVTHFSEARGLNLGAPVYHSGIQVGRVTQKDFPKGNKKGVEISFEVNKSYQRQVKEDTTVSINSMGMLGDKVVILNPGTLEAKIAESGFNLAANEPKALEDYLDDGSDLLTTLNKVAQNLETITAELSHNDLLSSTLTELKLLSRGLRRDFSDIKKESIQPTFKKLDNILAKIEKGEGTLGALVNDSALHEDLRVLLGGAKRSKLLRFLVREAIAQKEGEGAIEKK